MPGSSMPSSATLTKKSIAPAVALAVLAPVIAEVLSGATRLSFLFALIPEIMVWGCGALLIREAVRRRRLGWTGVLLMGLALSLAEELLIQQTSLAPLPWPHATQYGRVLGVNWIYLLWMLGYESVWVVLIPIQLSELIFKKQRDEPWVSTRGLIATSVVFLLGSYVAWYAWIKRARPLVFHAAPYRPPLATLLIGFLAIVGLVLAALRLKPSQANTKRYAPAPALVGVITILLGLPWYALISLNFLPAARLHDLPFWIPAVAAIAFATLAYNLLSRWSSTSGWNDLHRYALVFAAILVCITGGFLGSSTWPRLDLLFKIAVDLVAIGSLAALGRVISKYEVNR